MVSGLPVGTGSASMVSGLPVGTGSASMVSSGSAVTGKGFLEQLLFAKWGEGGEVGVEGLI